MTAAEYKQATQKAGYSVEAAAEKLDADLRNTWINDRRAVLWAALQMAYSAGRADGYTARGPVMAQQQGVTDAWIKDETVAKYLASNVAQILKERNLPLSAVKVRTRKDAEGLHHVWIGSENKIDIYLDERT